MRGFANSLRGQLILVAVAALFLAQAVSLWLFVDERSLAVRAAMGLETAGRAANIARLIEAAPAELHSSILRAANSPLVRFSIAPRPSVDHFDHGGSGAVASRIAALMGNETPTEVRVELHDIQADMLPMPGVPATMAQMHGAMAKSQLLATEMQLSIRLATGDWLNVETRFHRPPLQWPWFSAVSFGLTTVTVLIAGLWFVLSRLTGPLRKLSVAADRFGRGEDVDLLRVTGPSEIRDLTETFNRMQERLSRFVADRTHLLAALSHDLRSPLTAVRVRAEMVEDDETRERIVSSVEEMQDMVETTMSFARGMATAEASETVECGAFLDQLCTDLSETGSQVSLKSVDGLPIRIRTTAMRRAIRNVIENAVRYGNVAHVALAATPNGARISITDEGPGIPEDQLEKVFDPFVRLEKSRSRETGGTGLGLSIARTIIQAHGGSIQLRNTPKGGLSAIIDLPLDQQRSD